MIGRLFLVLSPHMRREIAIWGVDLSLVGLVGTQFIAMSLPTRIINILSWLAVTLTCVDWLSTSDVREEQDEAT